jgi:uncharacterized protein (DUF2384 family)
MQITGCFESLAEMADYVLDSKADAQRWLNSPHRELDGRTPSDAAQTESGRAQAEAILRKLYYGLPV